jgi:hypothetical protein
MKLNNNGSFCLSLVFLFLKNKILINDYNTKHSSKKKKEKIYIYIYIYIYTHLYVTSKHFLKLKQKTPHERNK